ncbi:MAG: hypothetical protein ACYTF7_10170 [Planctomycetota bacterium]|jgi:hypothetical protein
MLTVAAVLLTSATLGAQTYHIGGVNTRESMLATPRHHDAGGVVAHTREGNAKLWYPRSYSRDAKPSPSHIRAHHDGDAAARYGMHPHLNEKIIYTRVGHQVIAISPLDKHEQYHPSDSSRKYKLASNRWLSEQGYVRAVRVHKNPRYIDFHAAGAHGAMMQHASLETAGETLDDGTRLGPDGLPLPRATIRIDRIERTKIEPTASAEESIRVFKPSIATTNEPAREHKPALAEADETTEPVASAQGAHE